jgi:hypothetical protein
MVDDVDRANFDVLKDWTQIDEDGGLATGQVAESYMSEHASVGARR